MVPPADWIECVVNVSEGRAGPVLDALVGAAGHHLLDVHADPDHDRAVLTLAGPEPGAVLAAVQSVATEAVARIDLRTHRGVHPRFGALDVVPFVPIGGCAPAAAVLARERFGRWAAAALRLPGFRYGLDPGRAERSLPAVRRQAFAPLRPDWGPTAPHETAGAVAVGARWPLVAYNVWLRVGGAEGVAAARSIAAAVRSPVVRALGFDVGGRAQVSMNLVEPETFGPAAAFDRVAAEAREVGLEVDRAELVGLVPQAVLLAVDSERWAALDLAPDRTIEARIARRWG